MFKVFVIICVYLEMFLRFLLVFLFICGWRFVLGEYLCETHK